jgi:hypothetical protein
LQRTYNLLGIQRAFIDPGKKETRVFLKNRSKLHINSNDVTNPDVHIEESTNEKPQFEIVESPEGV